MENYHTYQACIAACLKCAATCNYCASSCAKRKGSGKNGSLYSIGYGMRSSLRGCRTINEFRKRKSS